MDSIASEESEEGESSKNPSPRDSNAKTSDSTAERKKSTYVSRVSNPSSEDPKLVVIPEDVEVARGEEARFECVVVASAQLDVFWMVADEGGSAGKELEESVKYALEVENVEEVEEEITSRTIPSEIGDGTTTSIKRFRRTHRLRVFDVSEVDVGRYYCVCVNPAGRNASIFQLGKEEWKRDESAIQLGHYISEFWFDSSRSTSQWAVFAFLIAHTLV